MCPKVFVVLSNNVRMSGVQRWKVRGVCQWRCHGQYDGSSTGHVGRRCGIHCHQPQLQTSTTAGGGDNCSHQLIIICIAPPPHYHWWIIMHHLITASHTVFENTYFTFISDFKKWLFTFFFEMTYQKVVKSHKEVWSLLNVYINFGFKTPGCYGYVLAFITHSSQLHSFLCPHFWARCLMLVTVTYRYWLPVIEWPVKLYVLFTFLPRDASAERGNATVSCPSVCNV